MKALTKTFPTEDAANAVYDRLVDASLSNTQIETQSNDDGAVAVKATFDETLSDAAAAIFGSDIEATDVEPPAGETPVLPIPPLIR